MAQQGKSAHIHLLQKELYYTETQHISFTHLSVLPISPDNNDFNKRKKKNQVKISLAPFYGGLFSPLYATWLTSSHSVRNTHTSQHNSSLSHYRAMHTEFTCWISTRSSYLIRGVSDGSKARKKNSIREQLFQVRADGRNQNHANKTVHRVCGMPNVS